MKINFPSQPIASTYDDILSNVFAHRKIDPSNILDSKLQNIPHPRLLKNIDKATARIADAIINNEVIALVTDHDCDGQTSQAIFHQALNKYFKVSKDRIICFIGHRLHEGYGLTKKLCDRILKSNHKPTLIITGDLGSSDEEQIAHLKLHNIDVVVTDHHQIPKNGGPSSAFAFVNPNQIDCTYPDKYIAGCYVAWLTMAAVRNYLISIKYLDKNTASLASLLDYVAVGTIADCMSLAHSPHNRSVVKSGLKLINNSQKACWVVLRKHLNKDITCQDVAFFLAPCLNADGRLNTALNSVSFLLSIHRSDAQAWLNHLIEQNDTRKSIQNNLIEQACSSIEDTSSSDKIIIIKFSPGHPGIQGIIASKIKEKYGKPCIVFSDSMQNKDELTGSARSIDDIDLKSHLDKFNEKKPNIILKYGGHAAAAGIGILKANFCEFKNSFIDFFNKLHSEKLMVPYINIDCIISKNLINQDLLSLIQKKLEPYGKDFSPPIFAAYTNFQITKLIGKNQDHAKGYVINNGKKISAICFYYKENLILEADKPKSMIIFSLMENVFQQKINWELRIIAYQTTEETVN